MAVRHGYGKIAGADALVFAYDTGDTKNSYKGEPTNNLFGTTAMEFKDDYGVYTNNIESGTDSIGKYFIKDTVNAPWWAGLRVYQNGVSPLTAGVSYVVSFECRSPQYDWSWGYDSNASGGGWSGNDTGRLSNTSLVFDKTGGTVYTQDMLNTWQRVTYRVTMKDATTFTGASAYPHDSFFPNQNNIKIYYRNAQLEVGRTTATQYTPTSRSATQGLLDLTGNNTLNVTNASFDSSAQVTFDGTSDYITIPHNTVMRDTDSLTVETVFKVYSQFGYYGGIIGKGSSDADEEYFLGIYPSGNKIYFDVGQGSGPYVNATQTINSNQYYHVVAMHERSGGTSTCSIYVNGEFVSNTTSGNTNSVNTNTTDITIGARWSNGSYSLNGDIPLVKMYNRALTAAEIKNNYNNYKSRFNL